MSIWLVMQTSDGIERQFAVRKPQTVIGRETNCDVRIPVPAVSRQHCRLTIEGDDLRFTDLGSTNGTFHNGNRVSEARLTADDRLTIGPVTFVIRVLRDALLSDNHVTDITIVRENGTSDCLNMEG
jgi:pSer/pThr/pTyr-binding forkhead associated (FHA) protein